MNTFESKKYFNETAFHLAIYWLLYLLSEVPYQKINSHCQSSLVRSGPKLNRNLDDQDRYRKHQARKPELG